MKWHWIHFTKCQSSHELNANTEKKFLIETRKTLEISLSEE